MLFIPPARFWELVSCGFGLTPLSNLCPREDRTPTPTPAKHFSSGAWGLTLTETTRGHYRQLISVRGTGSLTGHHLRPWSLQSSDSTMQNVLLVSKELCWLLM